MIDGIKKSSKKFAKAFGDETEHLVDESAKILQDSRK